MSWLCRIGLHRWEYVSGRDLAKPDVLVTQARCKRRCERYGSWMIVDLEKAPR